MNIDRLFAATAFAAIVFAALLVLIIATEPSRLQQASAEALGNTIEQGAALYGEHCRNCHGLRGEGVGQLGPPLGDKAFFTTRLSEVGWPSTEKAYILSTIEHGRLMGTRPIYAGNGSTAVMPAWLERYGGPLRSDQILAVTTFVENWRETALGHITLEPLELEESQPHDPKALSRGREVFIRSCSSCHTFGDIHTATVAGPDLGTIQLPPSYQPDPSSLESFIHEAVLIPEATIREEHADLAGKNPCGASLTVTELRDVTAFLLQ